MSIVKEFTIPELSSEEKEKSYSKYYYTKPGKPNDDLLDFLKDVKPMDSSKALSIENINDLLNPGYLEQETGYCVMPDGSGYVSVNNKMPGVTIDMVNWWFAWHALDDLRYKIWWPKGHFFARVNDEDRKKILDKNTPITEKFQGITHHVLEDVGGGKEDILISFLKPEDTNFDMSRFKSSNVGTLIMANGISSLHDVPDAPKIPAVMCHFVREIEGGIEFRSRFWLGYHIINNKPVKLLPPGISVPEVAPMGLAIHCIEEFSNLREILPSIYEEEKNNW